MLRLSDHHRIMMFTLRWVLQGVRSADYRWSKISIKMSLDGNEMLIGFSPILLSRQRPVSHVLMILHLLLLLLLLGDCILLLFYLGVIIALANINPSVGVDENLLKNS